VWVFPLFEVFKSPAGTAGSNLKPPFRWRAEFLWSFWLGAIGSLVDLVESEFGLFGKCSRLGRTRMTCWALSEKTKKGLI